MADQFDGPGSASGIKWVELENLLLLITPHEKDVAVSTTYGDNKAVRADIVALDGPDAPLEYFDSLIFPKVLAGQVGGNAGSGRMNLGRLGKGTAKPGQSAPWMLADPTDDDREVARKYLNARGSTPF